MPPSKHETKQRTELEDFAPFGSYVLLEDLEENKMSKGGIHLLKNAQKHILQGRIVKSGPGECNENGVFVEQSLKVGDVVWYRPYAGKDLRLDHKDYILVKEIDVMGVVVDE